MMMDKNDEVIETTGIESVDSINEIEEIQQSEDHPQSVAKQIEKWGLDVIEKDISVALFYLYF